MKRLTKRRPSPAIVVAALALFLSLGGVSYGLATGSIDSREIRNNTIRGKDMRNATISSRDLGDSGRPVRKFGPVTINARRAGDARRPTSPFTVVGQCQANGVNTRLRVIIATTETGSRSAPRENTAGSLERRRRPRPSGSCASSRAGPGAINHTNSAADGFSATAPIGPLVLGQRARGDRTASRGTAGRTADYTRDASRRAASSAAAQSASRASR